MNEKTTRNPVRTIRIAATLLLIVFAAGFFGTSAKAADAVMIAQRTLRAKIRREAGDRYGIQFFSAHVDPLPGGMRSVTGEGRFQRRGKNPQRFTYHITVDPRFNSARDAGYDIR